MNKFTVSIIAIFLLVMGFLYYDSDSKSDENNTISANEKLQFDSIKPPKVTDTKSDIKNKTQSDNLTLLNARDNDTKVQRVDLSERKEPYKYPFTEEGQAYMTKGELLFKNRTKINKQKYSSPEIAKQIKQAKYNLMLSKEIANLSKNLYIDTDEGRIMDQKIYAKINELSKNLIVTLKKQQNIE